MNKSDWNGSTADQRQVVEPALLVSRHQIVAINAARFLLMVSIVYATWHFGAVHAVALRNLSVLLGAAVFMAILAVPGLKNASSRLPVPFLALILLWIGYAVLQQTTIAGWLPTPFDGVVQVREQFGSESITRLNDAIVKLGGTGLHVPTGRFASVIPEATRQALVPFLLSFAVVVLSALLFNTRRSRRLFLWTVITNAGALAFWGIIQRAGGAQQILPGLENTYSSTPFSSFIYKNAGAAALLPALFGVAVILYSQRGRRTPNRPEGCYRRPAGARSILLDTKNLTLISIALLMVVGLSASLSRGAWFAATLASLVVWRLSRFAIPRREYLILGGVAGVAMLSIVAMAGIKEDIQKRAGQVSLDCVSADSRWEQWVDGWSAALANFPSGSGLGTYGFATLPHQSAARRTWFREAHNQYLEVFTESGFIGIALLLIVVAWFAVTSLRLIRTARDREEKSWGLLGIALLVCGGVQSIFDFVLVIPANLMLYAGLMGIVGAWPRFPAKQRDAIDRGFQVRWDIFARNIQLPAGWCAVAGCCLVVAFIASDQQLSSERALEATSVTQLDQKPDMATVVSSIETLDRAIARQSGNAALYQRRANWHLTEYRLQAVEAARRRGIEVVWANTRLENLFVLLSSQNDHGRDTLTEILLGTPQAKSRLADALTDLSCALSRNPLLPRTHLSCCALAPLVGLQTKPWLESSAALCNCSCDLLYLNGVLAFYSDELDLAVDQWSKSLTIRHTHLDSIFQLSQQKVPIMQIVRHLVPSNRVDLNVRLILSTKQDPNGGAHARYDQELSLQILKYLKNADSIESGRKYATIAQIWQLLDDHGSAARSWEAALRANVRHPGYRLAYSQSLSRLGRNDEALKQAILGQTLNPIDKRFEQLAARIRSEICRGRR